ncbi:MAG: two pore domain potassium channel family protein [Saprospiraceae bacterium]|nr:two pore domain potassium channel family protein [Saprospiraceae bacterium]
MTTEKISMTIRNLPTLIWNHQIRKVVLNGIAVYIGLTVFFGVLYFAFSLLDHNPSDLTKPLGIFECIYFSAVTFMTIGYGEIVPKDGYGQAIIFIESLFALTFTPVFGGYLAYKFLQRRKDILLTDNFFIRYKNNHIFLSSRVGNKGKNIIDCTATVEFIQIINNVKRTLHKREFNTPLVELTWFFDIRLDDPNYPLALQHLKTLLINPDTSMLRVTVIGVDSDSGNLVHVYKYYRMSNLFYGGGFSDVYLWEGVKRTQPNWANFNSVEPITTAEQTIIDNLLA